MKPDKRGINLIGVELEGGWLGERLVPPFSDLQLKRDGSINVGALQMQINGQPSYLHIGELCSPALEESKLWPWLKAHWPTHVHYSCGLHVHVSFDELSYRTLAHPGLVSQIHINLKEVCERNQHKPDYPYTVFSSRLNGENQYCRPTFGPVIQANSNGDARYSFLNFCYGRHRTVELRVLPMFPAYWMGKEAIGAFLRTIREWLRENRFKTVFMSVASPPAVTVRETYRVKI